MKGSIGKTNPVAVWLAALAVGVAATGWAHAGDVKPSISVTAFTNHTAASWWSGSVGSDLAAMLTNELMSTGDFTVVERKQLCDVIGEQVLAATGRTRAGTGPGMGGIIGAQYTITGSVSAYNEDSSDTGGGLNFHGFHIGGKKKQAYVAIDLRVINTETGQIAFSRTVEGRSSGHSVSLGGSLGHGLAGDLASKSKTPAGKSIRAALIEATDYLDCVMTRHDSCMAKYQRRENHRRHGDSDLLDLD